MGLHEHDFDVYPLGGTDGYRRRLQSCFRLVFGLGKFTLDLSELMPIDVTGTNDIS